MLFHIPTYCISAYYNSFYLFKSNYLIDSLSSSYDYKGNMFCIGNKDNMVTIDESESTVNHLPNGTLKILVGFKHPLEQNDQNAFVELITDFIGQP
ncbi:MAG: hypothetical protein JXQ87_00930 [Bacteroidia bacterium]